MNCQLSYNHRDGRQPQVKTYSNVGPQWTFNALSFVTDNGYCIISPCPDAAVVLRGHGHEGYLSLGVAHPLSRAVLVQVLHDPPRYERRLTDGTVEVFTQPDRPASEYYL